MNNQAIIVKINKIEPHPNADRLNLAKLFGTQVIVGKDVKEGDVLVYVDSNMKFLPDFLHNNNLYRHPEMNKDNQKKGFFEDNGRVKCIKMRGEYSDGFLFPVEHLGYLDAKAGDLLPGDEFDSVNGTKFCEKYIAPQKMPGSGNNDRQAKKKYKVPMFIEHWDTSQFMRNQHTIPAGTVCYIEEKIHGTSHRTAQVLVETTDELGWFKKILMNFVDVGGRFRWMYLNGTRRVVHTPKAVQEFKQLDAKSLWEPSKMEHKKQAFRDFFAEENGFTLPEDIFRALFPAEGDGDAKVSYEELEVSHPDFIKWLVKNAKDRNSDNIGYHDNTMREEVLEKVRGLLHKGEQIYLELYGYEKTGGQIQKNYPYGCNSGGYRATMYRSTMNNEDGRVVDYNREVVYSRAEELGFEKPHLFEKYYYSGTPRSMEILEEKIIAYAQGQSEIGKGAEDTLKEGVVIWFINSGGHWTCLKYKSDAFRAGESSLKDKGVVDQEDTN